MDSIFRIKVEQLFVFNGLNLLYRYILFRCCCCQTHNLCEDPWPHEVDHLGHLIDIDCPFSLQLLRQGGECTQRAGCYGPQPGRDTQPVFTVSTRVHKYQQMFVLHCNKYF